MAQNWTLTVCYYNPTTAFFSAWQNDPYPLHGMKPLPVYFIFESFICMTGVKVETSSSACTQNIEQSQYFLLSYRWLKPPPTPPRWSLPWRQARKCHQEISKKENKILEKKRMIYLPFFLLLYLLIKLLLWFISLCPLFRLLPFCHHFSWFKEVCLQGVLWLLEVVIIVILFSWANPRRGG